MSDSNACVVKDSTGNPAPLGLMGFGMTTVLLNFANAGFFSPNSMILAMGIFYGGIAQLIAGIMEWRKGNTFAATAFCSYGMFWLTLVWLIESPGLKLPPDARAMGSYFAIWGVFTLFLFIGTLRLNRALQFVFLTLTVLFALLAAKEFSGAGWLGTVAGYEGIVCGASAMYAGFAQVLNEVYGRTVLPLGPAR